MEDICSAKEFIVTRVDEPKKSKYGGTFRYIFFKEVESGTSYRTCIDDKCRNMSHWQEVISKYDGKTELRVVGLRTKSVGLIDADSVPRVVNA